MNKRIEMGKLEVGIDETHAYALLWKDFYGEDEELVKIDYRACSTEDDCKDLAIRRALYKLIVRKMKECKF